jgi:hypothetical protein
MYRVVGMFKDQYVVENIDPSADIFVKLKLKIANKTASGSVSIGGSNYEILGDLVKECQKKQKI